MVRQASGLARALNVGAYQVTPLHMQYLNLIAHSASRLLREDDLAVVHADDRRQRFDRHGVALLRA